MKILVTGSQGQVGQELLKTLAPLGPVIGLSRADGDLADADFVQRLLAHHRPDWIVNAAAYTAVDKAESEAGLAEALNSQLPQQLAAWAKDQGARLVHFSTDYVYAGKGEAAQTEDEPPAPLSVYGRTKLAGDRAILTEAADALIFRTAWVYAARGRNFMRTMLWLAAQRDELRVVADQWGAPTPAWLIAQVTALALRQRQLGRPGLAGVYHLTCRGDTNWYGFAREIIERASALGAELKVKGSKVHPIATGDYPAPAPRPANSRLSVVRLEQALQLQLPDWRDALAVTLRDWHSARLA